MRSLARRVAWLSISLLGVFGACSASSWAQSPSQIANFSVRPSSQVAGAHGDLSVNLRFATSRFPTNGSEESEKNNEVYPQEAVKKITVELPPGMLANPTSIPACEDGRIFGEGEKEEVQGIAGCGNANQVGVLVVTFFNKYAPATPNLVPVYNLTRSSGQTARFAARVNAELVHIDVNLRDSSDYGATASIENLPDVFPIVGTELILWGEPAASSHNTAQRSSCITFEEPEEYAHCTATLGGSQTFYSNPVTCSGPSQANAAVEFYDQPGLVYMASTSVPAFTGCEGLPFSPSLSFAPSSVGGSGSAGQPSSFTAGLSVPQEASDEPEAKASANVQNVSLRLPAGMALSPSVANGLEACSDEQFGAGSDASPGCPLSSAIGTVQIHSPLGDEELTGSLFIGSQESGEPASGEMYRVLLYAVGDGVSVKLVGHVAVQPSTGQLTVTFAQSPQVPFDELILTTKGGPQAPLVNPAACGAASSSWSISSWAKPESAVSGSSEYEVGGECALAGQFSPSLSAGPQGNGADSYSPFVFNLSRPDGQQELSGIPSVNLPAGVLARVGQVPECPSSQAAAGSCPESSQVGSATVGAGPGPDPFYLQNQPVYLTGPYGGAPFGLAVVAHAIAGPFNLGTVVVRQALFVNPSDAHVQIVSEPVPHILGGVPLRIQSVSLDIDRPGFTFNSTSCAPQSVSGTVTSVQGTSVNVASPYQAGNCAALRFKPALSATTPASTSKQDGAGLSVRLTADQGPGVQAPEANLREVEVKLPSALSVRLATLHKACLASVFNANPAACPPESIVGSASAHSPILDEALTGPAYIVSHGGEAFPDLELVLQANERGGEVTIILDGKTRVDTKHGDLLTSDFNTVPDAPISSFELNLPKGPNSILASPFKSLCGRNLGAPTRMLAQNELRIESTTHITVAGCALPLYARAERPRGATITVLVQAPAAGTLHAYGPQIDPQTRNPRGAALIALTLKLNSKAAAAVRAGKKLRAAIHLIFTPNNHAPTRTRSITTTI